MKPKEQTIKKPEYAGLFYPSEAAEYRRQLELALGEIGTLGPDYGPLELRALVVPSAGFSYSAKTALKAFELLRHRGFKRVVVLGSSHFFSFAGVAMTEADSYETILGPLTIDRESNLSLQADLGFQYFENAFAKEYSIELQLPYLKFFLEDFKLVPLILGNKLDMEATAQTLTTLLDNETLLVLSTNLSHYHSVKKARDVDRHTIQLLLDRDDRALLREGEASALLGLSVLNRMAIANNWQPIFLDYSDSSEGGDDDESVVGYGSLVYFQQ